MASKKILAPFFSAGGRTAIFVLLAFSLTGCAVIGQMIPNIASLKAEDSSPLKGKVDNVRILAILPVSADVMSHSATGMSGGIYERGSSTQDVTSPDVLLKATEQLQQNKRFQIITPSQVQKAMSGPAHQPILPFLPLTSQTGLMTAAEREASRKESISNAISQVWETMKADGAILIEAKQTKESGGVSAFVIGRNDAMLRLTMSVFSAKSGAVLWQQTMIKSINAGAFGMNLLAGAGFAQHTDLIAAMVENFNETFK